MRIAAQANIEQLVCISVVRDESARPQAHREASAMIKKFAVCAFCIDLAVGAASAAWCALRLI
jgi:hypothetical protein